MMRQLSASHFEPIEWLGNFLALELELHDKVPPYLDDLFHSANSAEDETFCGNETSAYENVAEDIYNRDLFALGAYLIREPDAYAVKILARHLTPLGHFAVRVIFYRSMAPLMFIVAYSAFLHTLVAHDERRRGDGLIQGMSAALKAARDVRNGDYVAPSTPREESEDEVA